jgi:hypothetical protein
MSERLLPKKITELGRIRLGDQETIPSRRDPKKMITRPRKLATFRLTSSNKPLLFFAANLYGGEVTRWEGDNAPEGQYELYTAVNSMDVLVPTASAVSVQYEQWSAGGCTLRCTGSFITHCPLNEALVGTECSCPVDDKERAEQAKDGKACARICRLNVLLPDLPGMGVWRLETKGYYATAELLGSLEMLQMAQHQIIEATLRLEHRAVKRWLTDNQEQKRQQSTTLQFTVPVLWPKYTPRQILAAADQRVLLMAQPEAEALPPGEHLAILAAELYGEPRATNFSHQEGHTEEKNTNTGEASHNAAKMPTGNSEAKSKVSLENPLIKESLQRYRALYQEYKNLPQVILQSIPQQLWDCTWQDLSTSPERLVAIAADYPLVAELLRNGKNCFQEEWPDIYAATIANFSSRYAALRADLRATAQNLSSMHPQRAAALELVDSPPWTRLEEMSAMLSALQGEEPEPQVNGHTWRIQLTNLLTVVKDEELLARMFTAADDMGTPDDIGHAVLAEAQDWVQQHS